jgi:hypothetical protein
MKRIFVFLSLLLALPVYADNYDYDDYTDYYDDYSYDAPDTELDNATVATNETEGECRMGGVAINIGAGPVAVGNFDIAGIMLGMTFEDAQMVAHENGLYANRPKNSVVYTIHPDWKYNLDYECRQQKIYAPEKLERCIRSLAQARGLLYAGELHLVRDLTGETIDVYFTSNATDNLVWKIVYKNDVDEEEGDNIKFENQREKKIMKWWQGVLDKYGIPNAESDKWASSDNAYDPLMTAYYGELDLVDCGRFSEDDERNIQQAQDNFATKPYAF